MRRDKFSQYFLFFCLIAFIILVFFIFRPFLNPLIMAAVFAVMFEPIYLKLTKWTKGHSSISALLVTIISIIVVIIPISFLAKTILKETTDIYKNLSGRNVVEIIEKTIVNAKVVFPNLETIELDLNKYIGQGLESLVQNIGGIFSSFAAIILNFFVFLMALYFFLRDGEKFEKYFIKLSPLNDQDDLSIISRLKLAIHATIGGNLAIGVIQGILTGIGFVIFGVPNPVLWGSIAAIAALLPGVGTALVLTPAIIYLFIIGNIYSGIGLIIWGMAAVGLIDNFLGPSLIGYGMKLHPLIVFISVLGGVIIFGPLGFIFGPLTISVCLALVDIYFSIRKVKL